MIKELQLKFIKTTMLVVTIMLVVFLASMNIVNFTLSRRESKSSLNQIVTLNLSQVPGGNKVGQGVGPGSPGQDAGPGVSGQDAGSGTPGKDTGPGASGQDAGSGTPGEDTGPGVSGEDTGSGTSGEDTGPGAPGQDAGSGTSGEDGGLEEGEKDALSSLGKSSLKVLGKTTESEDILLSVTESESILLSMTEPEMIFDELPDEENLDLGRYFVVTVNADGAITFSDLTHSDNLAWADMVDLLNKVEAEFAIEVTGETETISQEPVTVDGPVEGLEADGLTPSGQALDGYDADGPPALGNSLGGPAEEGETPPPLPEDVASGEALNPNIALDGVSQSVTGQVDGYMYYVCELANESVGYAFLDISQENQAVLRVVLITIALGVGAWFLVLVLVIFLSKRAIAPIAANIQRQRQFITNAGHEIKTPLAIIVSNVDVQELHSGKSKWLDNIRAQALRLSDLTKQMLTLSRMEENEGAVFVSTIFDASLQLIETLRVFRESASLRGIKIRTQIDEGVKVRCPREQYQQMLELLLDNAVKYAKENGFISVLLRGEHRCVRIRISNECDTLPDTEPDRLFDRFYRADMSRSRHTGGSGIGLAVVRAIAENLGGKAEARYCPGNVIEFEVEIAKNCSR